MAITDTGRTPDVYSGKQMLAHWMVVALVLFQFLQGGSMETAFDDGAINGGAIIHGLSGTLILGVMLWRLWMRRDHGAPPPPETEPSWLQRISRGVHYAFYAILIGMPLAGMAAVLTGSELLGSLHKLTAWLLLALALLHAAGAAWHGFVKRDGVVRRMLRDDPSVMS